MDIKNIAIGALVVLFAGSLWLNAKEGVGGVPGISILPTPVMTISGGGVFATTSAGAASTLATADIDTENIVSIQPLGANHTLTLPASTSFPGIPNPGDYRNLVIENAATAATTTTIAAGTGVDLQEPDGQNVVIGQTNYAFLTCYRKANTDITCRVDETIPAD